MVKSPYPFQAGAERTYDELYHGPWRARVDLNLYARPRSKVVVGKVRKGQVVEAIVGETIVVHPLRFVAAQDTQVGTDNKNHRPQVATMHKGDVFWILDSGNEGEFSVWWHCKAVGWNMEAPVEGDQKRLDLLNSNEERWVKIRISGTSMVGWFQDFQVEDGPKLVPAHPTTKSTG
jgi:hypothetical protein